MYLLFMSELFKQVTTQVEQIVEAECIAVDVFEVLKNIESHLFLYSYLRDLVVAIKSLSDELNDKQLKLFQVMSKRLAYLPNWQIEHNTTIELILERTIAADQIKPHIRLSDAEYEAFYAKQNNRIGERLIDLKKTPFNRFKAHTDLVLNPKNFDHIIRKTQALNVIENFMGVLESYQSPINRKWLDVGCGNGSIANAVDSKKHSSSLWQIQGCDLQKNRIAIANARASYNRTFYQQNVLQLLQENSRVSDQFDIISMFEFCEHFADPFALLKSICQSDFKLLVIATPLEQNLNKPKDSVPDPVHLWSFSAQAIITMLEQLGLKVVYHAETHVGQYTRGLNWLTVVAAKPKTYDLLAAQFNP